MRNFDLPWPQGDFPIHRSMSESEIRSTLEKMMRAARESEIAKLVEQGWSQKRIDELVPGLVAMQARDLDKALPYVIHVLRTLPDLRSVQ